MSEGAPAKLGRYSLQRELGKGAMGIVYEGRDPNIGRCVAIKTARRDVLESSGNADELLERFLREAKAAGALNHPNIITIYDAGTDGDTTYIAMEYIEGCDLRDWIKTRTARPVEDYVGLMATLAEALAYAHANGVVHRDIKPANILMPNDGPPKIADFGIAHLADSELTQQGALIGTPHYMSPEQFMGQRIDGRSDLFSLAVILYELATGERPFGGEQLSTIMHHVTRTEPVVPHTLNPAVPRPLSEVLLRALAKAPQDRYRDGRALAAALYECLKPEPDPAILSGADPREDATVNLSNAGATVLSHAPEDATVHTAAPAASTPPPQTAEASLHSPDSMATIEGTGPRDTNSETQAGRSLGPPTLQGKLLPVGFGALVVVGIALYALFVGVFAGEPASHGEAATAAAEGERRAAAAEEEAPPAATAQSQVEAVVLRALYRARDAEAFAACGGQPLGATCPAEYEGLTFAEVTVRVYADGQRVGEARDYMNGRVPLDPPATADALRIVLNEGQPSEVEWTVPAKPNDAGTQVIDTMIVLPPAA